MQILTYFSLLAGRGHEAAAIAALQGQEMSRRPAKISAAMPLADTAPCMLLAMQGQSIFCPGNKTTTPGPVADEGGMSRGL